VKIQEFQSWLEKQQVDLSLLELREIKEMGIGLIAKSTIPVNFRIH
jgi:hypothetical protein